jgi:MFS family permease
VDVRLPSIHNSIPYFSPRHVKALRRFAPGDHALNEVRLPDTVPLSSDHEVIAVHGNIGRWIEPWYGAYAILGALASGLAVISIPLAVIAGGGSAVQIGGTIAAQNLGALFAPFWGTVADRSRAYRVVFFAGFILIGLGFLGFTMLRGMPAWFGGAFLIGFGTGASNTVASLFVVEFAPKNEWSQRISWMQTFNALGSVVGMAVAGLLAPRIGTLIAAFLVIPAIILGGRGLPVPGGRFHLPRPHLSGAEMRAILRHAGPNGASVIAHLHRPRLAEFRAIGGALSSGFGLFLACWFLFSLAVSSFGSLYPVLMEKSFGVNVAQSALLMSIATGVSIPLYNLAGRLASRRGPAAVLGIGIGGRMVGLAGLAVVAFLHPGAAFLPVIILFGLYQVIWPLLSVASNELAAGLAPFGEGAAMGLFNAVAAIASAFGAIIGGKVADVFGYPAVSLFAAAVALAALACVAALRRRNTPVAA